MKALDDDYYYFPEGECPEPCVYEVQEDFNEAVLWNADGEKLVRPKRKIGLELK